MKFFKFITLTVLNICFIKSVRNADITDYEEEHLKRADSYLSECTVLLRKNGDFPLSKNETQIYLIGNGARNTLKGGTGSGEVNSRTFETIEDAFTNRGYDLLTSKDFLDAYDQMYLDLKNALIAKNQQDYEKDPTVDIMGFIMSKAGETVHEPEYDIPLVEEGDVAIYVLSRISGEGQDRKAEKGDVFLTDSEKRDILTLARGYKKFMLVLNVGGPIDLSELDEVENILILSQLGVNTSKTLVDIVSGEKYPSGKLTTTWTKFEDYPTIGDFGNDYDNDYKEGIFVGYRYFDTVRQEVMFPFGFGLGYTDFKFDIDSVNLIGEEFNVKTTVKNVGEFNGKEVLEVYLSKPNTQLDEPYQVLVNFAKTKELKPNEQQTLSINFKLSDFASYDMKREAYVLNRGTYIVRIGNSSRNTKPCGQIIVKSRIIVKQLKNKLGDPGFEDISLKYSKKCYRDVPKFVLDPESIQTITETYEDIKINIPSEVEALSIEDKAKLVIGNYGDKWINTVAGSSGETVQVGNIRPILMADGPAGLRLSINYYIDETGVHSTDSGLPSAWLEYLPESLKQIVNSIFAPQVPEDAEILHQYTTGLPIATALAQSWNTEFAEVFGDIVGSEMEIYKVNLWLAPALNIHRNILCGRNFEYYSEDPFISGMFAASVVKNVQKHKNAYATIKHFAANNQEYNRYVNSSNASERALREIYLKGFEICIRESKPRSLMTSYNLINGIHVNENKELIYDVLRKEFGFDGVIMTDWTVESSYLNPDFKYSKPLAHKVMKTTGNIFMPGSEGDYNDVLEGIGNGTLTEDELNVSVAYIYELSKEIEKNES